MTPEDRKALAQQIATNPLTEIILSEIEASATEALIYAEKEQGRVEAQWRVRAARAFRDEITRAVNNRERKGAPV